MDLETIASNLQSDLSAKKGRFAEISRMAGLSDGWLSMFAAGQIANPGVQTLLKLQRALHSLPPATPPREAA